MSREIQDYKILQIANGVYPDNNGWCGYKLAVPIQGISGLDFDFVTFNPYISDADAFKVLEALIALLIKTPTEYLINLSNARLQINDDGYLIVIHPDSDKTMFGLSNREAICEAYLSLIQDTKGE